MKHLILCLTCAVAFASIAEEAPVAAKRMKLTPEQRAARRAERAKRFYEKTGGFVQSVHTGKVVRVVNTTSKVDNRLVDAGMLSFRANLDLPLEVISSAEVKDPKGYFGDSAGLVIVLVDDAETPTVLTSEEEAWAKVNVGRLAADGADGKIVLRRTIKEIWRAAAFALGAGYSELQPDLMGPVRSLADLDKIKSDAPSPVCYNMMIGVANRFGITPCQTATYLQACEQGWAPAPTNDVQKAIWDKVHAMPAEPLKIKPETKKVSD